MHTSTLVFATNNQGKLKELSAMLPHLEIQSLQEIGYTKEIPEPFETFQENALTKAKTVFDFCGLPVLSDDSGLCVEALGGAPGVHSAYYGGEHGNAKKNIQKLLNELKPFADRSAYFISLICLVAKEETHYFEGRCEGEISKVWKGHQGFGYDPVFIPEGYEKSFAEMELNEKNKISHRGKALSKLLQFLNLKQ